MSEHDVEIATVEAPEASKKLEQAVAVDSGLPSLRQRLRAPEFEVMELPPLVELEPFAMTREVMELMKDKIAKLEAENKQLRGDKVEASSTGAVKKPGEAGMSGETTAEPAEPKQPTEQSSLLHIVYSTEELEKLAAQLEKLVPKDYEGEVVSGVKAFLVQLARDTGYLVDMDKDMDEKISLADAVKKICANMELIHRGMNARNSLVDDLAASLRPFVEIQLKQGTQIMKELDICCALLEG